MTAHDDARFAEIRQALERATSDAPTPFASLRAVLVEDARRVRRQRAIATTFAAAPVLAWLASVAFHPIVAGVCPDFTRSDVVALGMVPAAAWMLGVGLIGHDAPWAQLLVRSTWWSLHVTGLVLTWTRPGLLPVAFPAAAVGGGAALLVLGHRGIAPFELEGPLRPRRHAAAVIWLSLLGGADLLTMAAANAANGWGHPVGTAAVAALAPAVVGVLALRRWAPHATIAANLVFVAALWNPVTIGVPATLAKVLMVSALLQVALSLRILRSLVRGLEADLPHGQPFQHALFRTVITLGIVAALVGAARPVPVEALAASCAESSGATSPGAP